MKQMQHRGRVKQLRRGIKQEKNAVNTIIKFLGKLNIYSASLSVCSSFLYNLCMRLDFGFFLLSLQSFFSSSLHAHFFQCSCNRKITVIPSPMFLYIFHLFLLQTILFLSIPSYFHLWLSSLSLFSFFNLWLSIFPQCSVPALDT